MTFDHQHAHAHSFHLRHPRESYECRASWSVVKSCRVLVAHDSRKQKTWVSKKRDFRWGRGEGEKGKEVFSPSALSLFRFHLSPFPQKRLILRLPIRGYEFLVEYNSGNNRSSNFKSPSALLQADLNYERLINCANNKMRESQSCKIYNLVPRKKGPGDEVGNIY